MKPLALRITLPFSLALACSATCIASYGQSLATYGDAPAAEAEGAAAAANRAGNGTAFTPGNNDASLLGGPTPYGEVYRAQTLGEDQQQNGPATAANPPGRGVTPVEHMLNNPGTPQPAGPAIPTANAANLGKPGTQAGGNAATAGRGVATGALSEDPNLAAQQLYGKGYATQQLYGNGAAAGVGQREIYKSPW
jgi:hypothetical protein